MHIYIHTPKSHKRGKIRAWDLLHSSDTHHWTMYLILIGTYELMGKIKRYLRSENTIKEMQETKQPMPELAKWMDYYKYIYIKIMQILCNIKEVIGNMIRHTNIEIQYWKIGWLKKNQWARRSGLRAFPGSIRNTKNIKEKLKDMKYRSKIINIYRLLSLEEEKTINRIRKFLKKSCLQIFSN